MIDDLVAGLGAVLQYDAFDGFYYHHNAMGYWGQLAWDQTTGVYTPRKRFYAFAQVNRFVTPGAQRIQATDTISTLDHLIAFYDAARSRVSIIGRNTGATPITINGQIAGLPISVTSLVLFQTNSTVDMETLPVTVTNGTFSLTIPPDTIFSLANN